MIKSNTLKRYFVSLMTVLYLEFLYHIVIFKGFSIKDIFYIILFCILFTLFLSIISGLLPKKVNKWFLIILLCLLPILFICQYINFLFYGNIISIYSFIHGGQVLEFFGAIKQAIFDHFFIILLFILPIPLLLIFNKKIPAEKFKYQKLIAKIICFIIVFIISLLSLNLDKKEIYSAKNLFYYKHVPNSSAQTFGILTTMSLDLERIITNFEEKAVINNNSNKNNTPINKVIEYNKTDIDFNALAENEENKKIKSIHTYMANEMPSEKNEYTGMFKGKNLIEIVAEAFYPIAVDEKITPTLYKLTHEGFHFTNFYTPLYYVSTSDGEYVTLNSLIPKEGVWSFYVSRNNLLPYAYGNVFKKLGYTANAYHNGRYKYYDRNLSHPNMGYNYMGCGNGLEKLMNCKPWPQSDVEMMNATVNLYADKTPFVTYYMTISGHLEYNFMGNSMAYKHRSEVANLPYSEAIKAYYATHIELDKALESLIKQLEEKGILDDTVIVISADHYPYGLTNDQIKEVLNIEDEKFDIHKNNLIIWNNNLEYKEIDKYAMSLDILPTVLNLFGVEYDSRLLMGRDILSNSDGLVIFNDRSWISEYGKYNAPKKTFTPFKELKEEDYVEKINEIVYNKFVISKNILENDYYRKVFKGE